MSSTRSWPGTNEVHIWQARLDLAEHELRRLRGYLSVDERARVARYRHERERTRYTGARGWLRYLLAGYLGAEPRDLAFMENEHGKPRLADGLGRRLRFNVSHSEEVAVYAVADTREVGIDVERLRGDVPTEVVHRYFSVREQKALAALPAAAQLRGFFEGWTRKEAYVKGKGVGLGGLARVDAEAAGWSLHSIDVGPDYAAALAVAGAAHVPATATSLHLDA